MPRYREASISFMPPLRPVLKSLLIVTSVVFLLTYLPAVFMGLPAPLFADWLGLRPYAVTHWLFIWQPFTYLFLHAGLFHIIFNLFALWMFGSEIESRWGGPRFLFYFFLTGVGAGFFNVLLDPSGRAVTIGNSGAVYGVLLAYGVLFPDRPIFLWFIIPIKAKWFVVIMGAIELLASFNQPGSGISHVAHLGGMLFGYLYLKGHGTSYAWQRRYGDWRRARLRRKFQVYMRKHEGKDDHGRWIN